MVAHPAEGDSEGRAAAVDLGAGEGEDMNPREASAAVSRVRAVVRGGAPGEPPPADRDMKEEPATATFRSAGLAAAEPVHGPAQEPADPGRAWGGAEQRSRRGEPVFAPEGEARARDQPVEFGRVKGEVASSVLQGEPASARGSVAGDRGRLRAAPWLAPAREGIRRDFRVFVPTTRSTTSSRTT